MPLQRLLQLVGVRLRSLLTKRRRPRTVTPRTVTPRTVTPRTVTPRTVTSTLAPLPPEIVLLILEQLPPESVVSFALTCRAFYMAFMSPDLRLRLSPPERESLLLWLEQDVAGLYFCHHCNMLHPWRRDPQSSLPVYNGACQRPYESDCGRLTGFGFEMDYHVARLAMNRHLYGPSHGPPLGELRPPRPYQTYDHTGPPATNIEQFWEPRIIEGELCLHITITLHRSRGSIEETGMDTNRVIFNGIICPHLSAIAQGSTTRCAIPELHQSAFVPDSLGRVSGQVRSCSQCFTDCQIDIIWKDERRRGGRLGWVVQIQKWHQLGNCRSPREEKWYGLVKYRFPPIEKPRSQTCPAGMVRRRWMEHEGISWDFEGSFLP